MMKLRHLLVLLFALGSLAVLPAGATAEPHVEPEICSSAGRALSGSFGALKLSGNNYVPRGASFAVYGNLELAPKACLDAFSVSNVIVLGNIEVRPGAILALGCSPGAVGPEEGPCKTETTRDLVTGEIFALDPLTMYLTADTVGGNVTSIGGGPGPTLDPYINFPTKENTIGGNLTILGWSGAWMGVLRNTIYGNAQIDFNTGVTISPETGQPDSSEIVSNKITGNLTCLGNSPAAQFGDSKGSRNIVHGLILGQCTAVSRKG